MKCPECGSEKLLSVRNETLCGVCGLVIEEAKLTQHRKTWAPYEMPTQARAGAQSVNGKLVQAQWLLSHQEKKKEQLRQDVAALGQKLGLTSPIIKDAILFTHSLQRKEKLVGRNSQYMLVGCLYAACMRHDVSITHLDVALRLSVNKHAVLKYYALACKELGLPVKRLDVADLMHTYVAKLGVPPLIGFEAEKLYYVIRDLPFVQARSSYIIASSLLYAVGKNQLTQAQIAYVSGVHEATMRSFLKLLKQRLPNEL